jgi:hypothetical protein
MAYQFSGNFEQRYVAWEHHAEEKDTTPICFPLLNERDSVFQVRIIEDEFQNAYGTYFYPGSQIPQFIRVTLVSKFALQTALGNYQQLSGMEGIIIDRESFRQTLIRQFKKSNPEETEYSIANLQLKFVLGQLLWFVNVRDIPDDALFRDMLSTEVVSDSQLEKLTDRIRESEKIIENIVNLGFYRNKVNTFISNNDRYFWIHTDVFP